jgi:hypothetical protein
VSTSHAVPFASVLSASASGPGSIPGPATVLIVTDPAPAASATPPPSAPAAGSPGAGVRGPPQPDQPRLERAHSRSEEPLGRGADRLRLGARCLELRDESPAVVQERKEPLHEGNRRAAASSPWRCHGSRTPSCAMPGPCPDPAVNRARRTPGDVLAKAPARRATLTPEAIAKTVTDRPEPGRSAE